MPVRKNQNWPLGKNPSIADPFPPNMAALVIRRDQYGPPVRCLRMEEVPGPRLHPEDGKRVLVAILATGPNFNTNFASLGLPVPVFGRGDGSTRHIPGSDALGIVVGAGASVRGVAVGQAVILDSWTGAGLIRGYETHDGFNAQFAVVDEERAIPVPAGLKRLSPERLAAMLLTYGTAYRAVVERLAVRTGESVLLMGGGKGTSFAGAQIAKALGARVLLVGSNAALAGALVKRGIADAFVDRRRLPQDVFGVVAADTPWEQWRERTEPFRQAVFAANGGRPVDAVFEHTGGRNFPLLVSLLADGGRLAFFGATGGGLKGEYKETFFYAGRRFVLDARWVWMRQKQVLFRDRPAREIFDEIRLPPGRRGLIWGADDYALDFARAALARRARLAFVVSKKFERQGLRELKALGVSTDQVIDRDQFSLAPDMPDPLTEDGRPNPAYGREYMDTARALGRAVWGVFGPRMSPDFVVERTDQNTLHFSTFLLRDYDEADDMPCGFVVIRGPSSLGIHGSHMYRASQAREVVGLLDQGTLVMEQEDLEVTGLQGLPEIQQKMLEGRMDKPKGVALVQADRPGRPVSEYEDGFLGETLVAADPSKKKFIQLNLAGGIGVLTLCRTEALNALNQELLSQLGEVIAAIGNKRAVEGRRLKALIIRGSGRAFVAGADVTEFHGSTAKRIAAIAGVNIGLFSKIEKLPIPVIALLDGFTLGGGNELAMAAHHRIVTENALIGQPEIKLGIIPGYGGLQRLPRLVGPLKAVEMSVNGESIGGREALSLGLADAFAPSATALAAAFDTARGFVEGRKKLARKDWDAIGARQAGRLRSLLKKPRVRELLAAGPVPKEQAGDLAAARAAAARFVIQAVEYGYRAGFRRGLGNDARLFGEVAASPSGQEWIRRFIEKDPRQSSFLDLMPPG